LVIVKCDKCGKEFEVDDSEDVSNFRCPCETCEYESSKTKENLEHPIKKEEEDMDCASCCHKG